MAIFEPIFAALNEAQVRYVVVGGLATVLHGHARLTVDLDVVVDLASAEAERTIAALTAIGFAPRLPVGAREFANADTRARWQREKNMQVFPLIDPSDPLRQVDLFVESPIEFESLWARAETVPLGSTTARVACIDDLIDLIEMKKLAGRTKDLADIEALEAIRSETRSGPR